MGLALLTSLGVLSTSPESAQPQAPACNGVAAPGGSDSSSGTASDPFRSVGRLARSLSPGESGCLRGGVFRENVVVRSGGRAGAPIALGAYPGERPRLEGRLIIEGDADFVTVTGLALDGTASPRCSDRSECDVFPSPTVYGDNVTFRGNDVTHRGGICFILGRSGNPAVGTLIEGNRIHGCGRRPRTNHDHGIYVESARDGRIVGNIIYGNADRGVQLYPSAQRMRIAGNVIDGNGQGVIFSGDGGATSNGNVVEGNVITNAVAGHNVLSYYPPRHPVGRGNVLRRNCLFGGARGADNGGVQEPQVGFAALDNRVVEPGYTNRAAGDFRLRPDSPCLGLVRP